jgi:hypothetical protein
MKAAKCMVYKFVVLTIPLLLQGCAVGIAKFSGPAIPPKTEITSLHDVAIYINYQTCSPKECAPQDLYSSTYSWASESEAFLASEYGITTKIGEPTTGERAIYVLVTKDKAEEPVLGIVSGVLHFVSFSLIPGYWYNVNYFNIQVVFAKPDGSIVHQNFKSQISKQEYLWLPLIIKADIFFSINGGIDNSDNSEHKAQAVRKVAGEIVREIQKEYQATGGVGAWNHQVLTQLSVH